MKKRLICLFTACIVFINLFGIVTFADENRYIHIIYNDEEEAVEGVSFSMYYLGIDENGTLKPDEAFSSYQCDFSISDTEKRQNLALTLEALVLRDDISPVAADVTDENGFADFKGEAFPRGVWLLLADAHSQNGKYYYTQPILILLPFEETNTVIVNPKFESSTDTPDSELTSLRVIKAWKNDSEESRPEKIEVQLIKDGEIADTVPLGADNNWQHIWTELPSGHHWTVAEKEPSVGYKVSVSLTEGTYVITNTKETDEPNPDVPDEPDEPDIPETGMLMWPVPYLALAGLFIFIIGFVYFRKSEIRNDKTE